MGKTVWGADDKIFNDIFFLLYTYLGSRGIESRWRDGETFSDYL